MNIFYTDDNPEIAAQNLCDKHVNKLLIETCQLLYSAHWAMNQTPSGPDNNAYKLSFANHPCAIWARMSSGNYNWLCKHATAICAAYTARYGKIHACQEHASWLAQNVPEGILDASLTVPALAIKSPQYDFCKIENDPVETYRNYYWHDKKKFAKWKSGIKPYWWLEREQKEMMNVAA